MTTLSGEAEVERAYYYSLQPLWGSKVPVDELLKLSGSRLSEGVIENLSYCCAELLFEAPSELMDWLTGVHVSPKEAQNLSESVGKERGENLDERVEAAMTDGPDTTSRLERLYIDIATDGVMIREQDGWQEAKMAVIYDTN